MTGLAVISDFCTNDEPAGSHRCCEQLEGNVSKLLGSDLDLCMSVYRKEEANSILSQERSHSLKTSLSLLPDVDHIVSAIRVCQTRARSVRACIQEQHALSEVQSQVATRIFQCCQMSITSYHQYGCVRRACVHGRQHAHTTKVITNLKIFLRQVILGAIFESWPTHKHTSAHQDAHA